MIRINLIPYRAARQQHQILQHLMWFFSTVVLVALLALALHTYTSLQLASLKEQTIALQKQNEDLKSKIGKLDKLDDLRADVESKLKIVDRLQEGRFHSLKTLHAISTVIPENVWLEQIVDKGSDIELAGMGESNKAVANFMRRLDQLPIFSNVRLGEITRIKIDGLPVRRFTLKLARVDEAAAPANAHGFLSPRDMNLHHAEAKTMQARRLFDGKRAADGKAS